MFVFPPEVVVVRPWFLSLPVEIMPSSRVRIDVPGRLGQGGGGGGGSFVVRSKGRGSCCAVELGQLAVLF